MEISSANRPWLYCWRRTCVSPPGRGLSLAALLVGAACVVPGCTSGDEKVFDDAQGTFEEKPDATLLGSLARKKSSSGDTSTAPTEAANLTYDVKVTANSGASLCKGTVDVVLLSNFSFEFPEAFLRCSSLRLNLAGILAGGIGADGGGGDSLESSISHKDGVLFMSELAGATFSPPRPLLLGPIITSNRKYKNFSKEVQSSATTEEGKSGDGTFTLTVKDHEGEYTNKFLEENGLDPFEKVINWTMEVDGFDDFSMSDGLIIDSWEWHWNSLPVMIPAIKIKGDFGSFIGRSGGSSSAVVGKITIDIKVKDYTIVD